VAVAYHRAAGVYITDKDMQELGTAADSPSHHRGLLHRGAKGMKVVAMTGDESRLLKVGDQVCWKGSATDTGRRSSERHGVVLRLLGMTVTQRGFSIGSRARTGCLMFYSDPAPPLATAWRQ
jgi:hypothetical protein